jgi:PTS system nitrogen regulatory IIA component
MEVADLIAADAVLPAVRAGSRRQAFWEIGTLARRVYGLDAGLVANGLLARERQGTTGVGSGVAIPHAQLPAAKSIVGLFARLVSPVDFDAFDGRGVDLVIALLAPDGWHPSRLCALAHVCRLMHDKNLCLALRRTAEAPALYALITETDRQQKMRLAM